MCENNSNNFRKQEDNCRCPPNASRPCPPIRNVTHPLRYYEFTREEVKALEECDKESFYRRCLPLSALFASATYLAIRTGHMKRNKHFGAVPKLVIAVLMGHVAGRAAYAPQCVERLRSLPAASYLGEIVRGPHDGGASGKNKELQK